MMEVPAISKQVRFTARLEYNEQQELYRPMGAGETDYVGDPNPEMDAAWEALIGGNSHQITVMEQY
jgi:hypothetical protein